MELKKNSQYLGEWSLDQISLDIFSWSKVCLNLGVWSKLLFFYFGQLIEFHLIFSVDRKLKITQNDIIRSFNQLPKSVGSFLAVDGKFKISQNDIIKISIKCQKITCKFWHLIESLKWH